MFLKQLAKYICDNHAEQLGNACFVFPNRRSGLFFRRSLVNNLDRISWAPEIITINEFMQQVSGLELADPVETILVLYDIYKGSVSNPDPFDSFHPWGEMMISDYDSIDKYLVDPEAIFRNIIDLKEIEEKFGGLTEEQVEYIRKFWSSFLQGNMTFEKDSFLSIWKVLPSVYKKLNARLRDEGKGYEGMLYREASGMDMVVMDEIISGRQFYFVGFNALCEAEKRLFRKLQKRNNATFFWDYDEMYLNDQSREAGRFIRNNIREFPPPVDLGIFSNLGNRTSIRIYDLPTNVLQAKTMHDILLEHQSPVEDPDDTAVILCDENLLMPVLVSLPENIEQVNITMGYPFRSTPLNSFVEGIIKLQSNTRTSKKNSGSFYHKDVLSILNHQYYKNLTGNDTRDLISRLVKENHVYVGEEYFEDQFARKIFRRTGTIDLFCDYLRDILEYVLKNLPGVEGGFYRELDKEYILVMLNRLRKLETFFSESLDVELPAFIRYYRRILSNLRIPFEGEPLAGLQIMGILETRLLDFKNIIMLSVNEEVMPQTIKTNSFIPYSLRFAFGLPVREDMDAIYAYYFFRIIQRATNIDLLFNSATEGVNTGEMSRYLYQMKYEFGAEIIRPLLSVSSNVIAPVIVPKTKAIISIMDKYLTDGEDESFLSPSSLNTYVECRLKFYFRKVAGIGEQEELSEELDAIGFGNILHNTIQVLYESFNSEAATATAENLKQLLKNGRISRTLLNEFRKEYFKSDTNRELEGKNLVIYEILKRYIRKIVETDMQFAPFKIIDLEGTYQTIRYIHLRDGTAGVKIGGKIDRVDKTSDGLTRIIDYKTGSSQQNVQSIDSLFDAENRSRSKEAFQAFLYASLFLAKFPDAKVQPGLYVIKELYRKDFSPVFQLKEPEKQELITFNEHKDEFNGKLNDLLVEIFDPDVPFSQTEIEDRCRYCEFKRLCNR
ncbi:MAG: PD-(D/E)XK nuclease family protein [Bacteroidales bacterium]|nr:PD-(D/E)XK nuclease family protein [Bacteroidales bacterium]